MDGPDNLDPFMQIVITVTYSPQDASAASAELILTTNEFHSPELRIPLSAGAMSAREGTSNTPKEFALATPYPNPFNAIATISFEVPRTADASLGIFDATGMMVESLVEGTVSAGTHASVGRADGAAPGIYLAKLQAGEFTAAQKLLLVK